MFVGLLGGVSLAVQHQRYSDSVQSTHSFLQKQFNEVLNVVNNRDVDPCAPSGIGEPIGASSCFVMGKAIKFHPGGGPEADRIDVLPVVGHELAVGQVPSMGAYFGRIIENDANRQEYLIPWAASVVRAALLTRPSAQPIDQILLLRNPEGGSTMVYAFPPDADSADIKGLLNQDTYRVSRDKPAVLCLRSQDVANAFARITFNGSGSQDGVVAEFDQEAGCGLPG